MKLNLLSGSLLLLLVLVISTSQIHTQETSEDEIINDFDEAATVEETDIFTDTTVLKLKNKKQEYLIKGIEMDSSLEFSQLIFNVSGEKLNYQLELDIAFKEQVSFSDCVFTISYANETRVDCLDSYKLILEKPNAILKIYRKLIRSPILITYRLVNIVFFLEN